MARVTITRQWPEGDALMVSIKVKDTQPEATRVAAANALEAYTEALRADILESEVTDGDSD